MFVAQKHAAVILNVLLRAHVLFLGVSVSVSQLLLAFWIPLGGLVACAPTTITRQAKGVQVKQVAHLLLSVKK